MSQQTITFLVNDMHCSSCPKLIKMTLEELPGVSAVEASLESKKVTVAYDPVLVPVDKLVQSIKDDGYTPEVIPLA